MPAPKMVADNRKARFNYFIDDTVEAGIALLGTEVKSLREGRADISEAYVQERGGELYLLNAYIHEYSSGNRFNHDSRRMRKLLVHRRQLNQFMGSVKKAGVTIVPLKLYFNERGLVKCLIGLARGKAKHDKRASIKDRDWQRDKARILRDRG